MKHWLRTRAPFFAALGVVSGFVAALVSPEITMVQGLWGGFVGGLVGGVGHAVIRLFTRR